MLTLLFWNIGRRPLSERVAEIARQQDADIVILAECLSPGWVTRRLNEAGGPMYFPVPSDSRLTIHTRFAAGRFRALAETRYYSIRELQPVAGVRESLIVVTAHLPSKREVSDFGQTIDAINLSRAIIQAEDRLGHNRTVLVGDLNMNPFEPGVSAATGLHGVMTRDVARQVSRTVRERVYRFFYNPMWRFFGDGTPGPAGSYFSWRADEDCFFWNVFDQAMIRPELLDKLAPDGVALLDAVGADALLLPNGRPDPIRGSDHLPLVLRLDY